MSLTRFHPHSRSHVHFFLLYHSFSNSLSPSLCACDFSPRLTHPLTRFHPFSLLRVCDFSYNIYSNKHLTTFSSARIVLYDTKTCIFIDLFLHSPFPLALPPFPLPSSLGCSLALDDVCFFQRVRMFAPGGTRAKLYILRI